MNIRIIYPLVLCKPISLKEIDNSTPREHSPIEQSIRYRFEILLHIIRHSR